MNGRKSKLMLVCGLIVMASQLGVGLSSPAFGEIVSIITDTTWRGIGPLGNQEGTPITSVGSAWEIDNFGWNFLLTYDDSDTAGWKSCINNRELPYIWVDGPYIYGSTPSYYRKVFELPGTPTSGLLSFGCDDDAIIYINGQLAASDTDGISTDSSLIDVTSLLVEGTNLIAVKAHDSAGYQESLKVYLDIEVPLRIEIVGPYSVVLSDPIGANRKLNAKLKALAEPKGGEYEWTVLEGEDKVGLRVSNNGQSATVWGTAPSEALQDVLIKVTYTLGLQTCSDLHYMTVQKPSLLKIAWGFPDRWVWVNKDGQVIAYSMIYRYGVFDHLNPSNAINVEGMIVSESLELVSANHGWNQKDLKPYSDKTDILGAFNDEIGIPKSQKFFGFGPAEPIPKDLLVKVRQTILVEGWDVGTRCLTFYYDHATSEPGDCTP